MTVMVSGASMFAMAKILHLLLGWDMNVSIWVSSITVAIYVTLGGLISAVFNEVLQFFLIWLGIAADADPRADRGRRLERDDGADQQTREIHPTVNADFTSLWRSLGSFDNNPMGIDWFGMVFGLGVAVSLRLLVHRLPPGAAGDRGQEPPRRRRTARSSAPCFKMWCR